MAWSPFRDPTIIGHYAKWKSHDGTVPLVMQSEPDLELMRLVPISAFVGPNGSGKSLCATALSMRSLSAGRLVLSNVRLLDWENPRPCDDPTCEDDNHETHLAVHPNYIPWTRWTDIRDAENMDVFADEIGSIASSRDTSSMPKAVQMVLQQLRRRKVAFRWTAPAFARADVILRECSQAVVRCRGYCSVRGALDDAWPSKRLFRWVCHDLSGLPQDPSWPQVMAAPVYAQSWFWGPLSDVFKGYDTLDRVTIIARVSDSGICEVCDGTRRRGECDCPDYLSRKSVRTGRAGGPRGASRVSAGSVDAGPTGPLLLLDEKPRRFLDG